MRTATWRRRPGATAVAAGFALLLSCTPPPLPPVSAPVVAPPEPVVPPAVQRPPSEGRVTVGAAGGLYYHVVGSGADTVLVPLAAYLERSLSPLGDGHTLVFYDPRRRGRSDTFADSALSTFDADVGDLEAVREHVGASRVSVVGFSYFAAVAVRYAADHPDRVSRVVLLSPIEPTAALERAYDPPEALARIDTVKARRLVRLRAAGRDTTDAVAYCRLYWEVNAPVYVGDASHASRLVTDFCALPNEQVRAFALHVGRVMRSLGPARDFSPLAARLRAAVLVLRGDRDLVANPEGARGWAALFNGARLVTIAGAGHMLWLDEPRQALSALDLFLGGR